MQIMLKSASFYVYDVSPQDFKMAAHANTKCGYLETKSDKND